VLFLVLGFFKPSKGGGERILNPSVVYYYPAKGRVNFLPDQETTLYANNLFGLLGFCRGPAWGGENSSRAYIFITL